MSFEEWKEYIFSDFVDINPTIKLDSKKEYSFIEMKDLEDGKKFAYPSSKQKASGGARFQNSDTLFARITPCLENGKICQASNLENGIGFGSTEFLVFRGKKEISDTEFIFYLSRWDEVRKFAEQNLVGTSGRQRVGKEAFQNLVLNLPPLPTQRRIASILSSLDEKIELNRQTSQTLEAIAQAIFKEWFVDFNFPGATGDMQESELGEIPKGWRVASLNEIITVTHGYAFKGEYFSDEETEDVLLTPGNFKIGGGFNYSKLKYYNGDFPKSYVLNRGDVIVTMTDLSREGDTLGYSALVPEIIGKKLLHNQRIGKVVFKKRHFHSFIYLLMQQESYRNFILGGATGSTVRHTSPSRICEFQFVLPDKEVLEQFEITIGAFFDLIESNQQQIQSLIQLRDSLLPKLMKGEIDLNSQTA